MQYTIGWLKLKPGMREDFLSFANPHRVATLNEEGCMFYEWTLSSADADVLVLVEGWETPKHHQAHLNSPHHLALGQEVGKYAVSGKFEEIEAARAVTQRPEFGS